MLKILVAEDDVSTNKLLCAILKINGYEAIPAFNGEAALDIIDHQHIDLLLCDVMMPKMDGFALTQAIRDGGSMMPILMLTAKSDLMDLVAGLNAGADYYLTKPFDSRELLACVGALLRRQGEQVDELTFGYTALDLSAGRLRCGSKSVRLAAREFDVMRILLQAKGGNVSKETLLERVWGFDSNAVENHVEVYAGFLRKKLASSGSNVRIEAIRRLGYHLEVAEA